MRSDQYLTQKNMRRDEMIEQVQGKEVFSPDKLLLNLVRVSVYLLLFRIFYTFLFASLMGQDWHIRYMWDVIPIIAFSSDPLVFATLNAYAVLAIAATDFLVFLIVLLRKKRYTIYPFWAWYLGILMTGIQYATLLFLNRRLNFGIDEGVWLPLTAIAIAATLIVFVVKKSKYRRFAGHESEMREL